MKYINLINVSLAIINLFTEPKNNTGTFLLFLGVLISPISIPDRLWSHNLETS